jgi:hypothetical protein
LIPYLRRVENGVYEYRFLRYYQREITYISQFSEADAAAFNFTLDVSIGIKRHFRDLLQRHVRQQTDVGTPVSEKLSLPSLHVVLAELYGLDKEYAEAMGQYRNALQHMEPIIEAELDLHLQRKDPGNWSLLAIALTSTCLRRRKRDIFKLKRSDMAPLQIRSRRCCSMCGCC